MSNVQKAIVGAVVAAVIAFLSVLSGALGTEGAAISDLDAQTWINAAIAFLSGLGVTGGAVYATPNIAKNDYEGKHSAAEKWH